MNFILFFTLYFLLLIAPAYFILGWYAITRGEEVTDPDGTVRQTGKIFKGWYFFWFKVDKINKDVWIYYKGEELEKLFNMIKQFPEFKSFQLSIIKDQDKLIASQMPDGTGPLHGRIEENLVALQEKSGVKFYIKPHPTSGFVLLEPYKTRPNYVFPDWTRDMMAGCVTCHSSWLGTITLWTFILLTHSNWLAQVALWCRNPGLLLVVVNISFCISLAFITTRMWAGLKQ